MNAACLASETWKALGVRIEECPSSDQAFVLINGQPPKAHLSKGHFDEVNGPGAHFLDFCELNINYPYEDSPCYNPSHLDAS